MLEARELVLQAGFGDLERERPGAAGRLHGVPGLLSHGERLIGPHRDDQVVEQRRPEQRTRLCAELGRANARRALSARTSGEMLNIPAIVQRTRASSSGGRLGAAQYRRTAARRRRARPRTSRWRSPPTGRGGVAGRERVEGPAREVSCGRRVGHPSVLAASSRVAIAMSSPGSALVASCCATSTGSAPRARRTSTA